MNADELQRIWPVPGGSRLNGTEGVTRDGRAATFLDVSGMVDGTGVN